MGDNSRWSDLLAWLNNNHGMDISNNGLLVECRDAPGAGKGLFAVKSCPPSVTLFTIPAQALINVKTLSPNYPKHPNGVDLTAEQLISLHLLLHKPGRNGKSLDQRFGPFISTMPQDFESHPLTWSIRRITGSPEALRPEYLLLDCLPPSVHTALQRLNTRFWEDWRTLCMHVQEDPSILTRSSRKDLNRNQFDAENFSLISDYIWAWLNVNTRCIYYRLDPSPSSPDNVTLCPILDFANHRPSMTHIIPVLPIDVYTTPIKFGSKLGSDYRFVSCNETGIDKDQELFLRYGGHSNKTLFVEYGFVNIWPEGAIAGGQFEGEIDVQDLMEELLQEAGFLGVWLRDVLETEGYWGDWTLHSSPHPAHPSYRLITALRLYHIAEGPLADISKAEKALSSWTAVVNGQAEIISDENERRWRDTLLQICEKMKKRAMTRIQMLEDELSQEGMKPANWFGWMKGNIRCLWREELEVANSVAQSVKSGEEF